MTNRTQIVCLHEGQKGRSIDPVFINALMKELNPAWIRPWKGSNCVRMVDGGGRNDVMNLMPRELRTCLRAGGQTTLMVWADLDDNCADGDELKSRFWSEAETAGISPEEFAQVVFVFAKDRLENWVEYLLSGKTDESVEGPRITHNREVADAGKALAKRCLLGSTVPPLPPSLIWSCQNWRQFVNRMK